MTHLLSAALIAVGALASTTPIVPPATPPVQTEATDVASDTIETAIDRALRMTVPTRVNGQGPFNFTIDTGADRSVVSDRLATALALPPGTGVMMHGILGAQEVRTVIVARLNVGRTERRNISTPVLSEVALGSTGFLGLDALSNQTVLLDFKHHRITLASSLEARGDAETIVVTGRSKFGQLVLTDARIDGKKVYAIIDTGAQATVGNPVLQKMMSGRAHIAALPGELVGVTGSTIPAEFGTIPHIQLGGMALTNMPVAYADAHTFRKFGVDKVPAILVGMDVLSGFERVAVDFRRREVRFRVGDGSIARG